MTNKDIKTILDEQPELQEKIFARGFLFTNAEVQTDGYPFYGKWQIKKLTTFILLVAPQQKYCFIEQDGVFIVIIGHAYNPFTGDYEEQTILTELLKQFHISDLLSYDNHFWNTINGLTGVFTIILGFQDAIYLFGDASGMQTAFYLENASQVCISSHTNLIGDLNHLVWDSYITELIHYRFFKLLGNSLPGNLTQFKEVKRLVPNHYVKIEHGVSQSCRFYWPHKLSRTPDEIVDEVSRLLKNNLELIARKWRKPAISLTGGCDSKTTLSCAADYYEKYKYFSYISSDSEEIDALAAEKICKHLGLYHKIYHVSDHDEDFANVSAVREILNWNTGNIRYSHPNDIRKRILLADTPDFDVEVKSWASEIGRAYYSKRFHGRIDFGPAPTPRKCTTLYKFFLNNRKLVRQTDAVFEKYLQDFYTRADQNPIEWQEQFFWEFRVPSWNGLVITGEHRYSFDITIPYNNRRIIELLLSAPIEMRLHDEIYSQIRKKMNPNIDATGIAVTNLKHTENRERFENLYYIFNTHFM